MLPTFLKWVWPENLEDKWHIAILYIAVILSLGGVFFAIYVLHDPSQGDRGGALGTIISFFSLFVDNNYRRRTFKALTRGRDKSKSAQDIDVSLSVEADSKRAQNIYMALSASISTLFWGFGDVFSEYLYGFLVGYSPESSAVRVFFCLPDTHVCWGVLSNLTN